MREWFLGKVNEWGEKAVDSVVNIVLSRNDKTIADFKQTPLITAISRSVNSHIAIKQPNIATKVDPNGPGSRIGVVQVDLLESNYLQYPIQATYPNDLTSPAYTYYGKMQSESHKGRIYFSGLGSIPAGMCQYSVSMTCNNRIAYSPLVEMEAEGSNRVLWNHQFITELDDLWVDLALVVHAEIDFNQFSQQNTKYGSPRLASMPNRIPGVRCSQLSRSEAAEMDPEEAQRLTSIYGKTKYKQRIGRAILSLPLLLDSTELRSTSLLQEDCIHAQPSAFYNGEPGPTLFSRTSNDFATAPSIPIVGYSTPVKRSSRNLTPRVTSSYRHRECSHLQSDSNLPDSDMLSDPIRRHSYGRINSTRDSDRDHRLTQRIVKRMTTNTLREVDEVLYERSIEEAIANAKGEDGAFMRQQSLDASPMADHSSPQVLPSAWSPTLSVGSIADDRGSFKTCSDDSDGDDETLLTGRKTIEIRAKGSTATGEDVDYRRNGLPSSMVNGPLSIKNAPSRSMMQKNELAVDADVNLPLRLETASFPDLNSSQTLPAIRMQSQTNCAMDAIGEIVRSATIDDKRQFDAAVGEEKLDTKYGQLIEDLQSLEKIRSDYRYYVETVVTLQLLPFNEHKWDDEKYLRPVEGYPSFGMKAPAEIPGQIKVRVRVYLRNRPQLLAIYSNLRHPRIYWQVPKELEMLHLTLTLRRIELFFREKPRWVDNILLPKDLSEDSRYIALFWLVLLDLVVFAPLHRIVFDSYLLIFIVSLYYKIQVGVLKYGTQPANDIAKPSKKNLSSSIGHMDYPNRERGSFRASSVRVLSEPRQKAEKSSLDQSTQFGSRLNSNMNIRRDPSNGEVESSNAEIEKEHGAQNTDTSLRDFKGTVETMSTLATPFGERQVAIQRHEGCLKTAIYADDLGDTNYEEIVKVSVIIVQLLQTILGYSIMLAEKMRISLACADSISWTVIWSLLGMLLVIHYTATYLAGLVPLVIWRLGLYLITLCFCLSFHAPKNETLTALWLQVCSAAWARTKRSLWFFVNVLQRVPDSREIDHRRRKFHMNGLLIGCQGVVYALQGILGQLFLRPRKLSMRIDRRRTKREYRSRRHKFGYHYRWTGS